MGDASTFTISGTGFLDDAELFFGNLRIMPIDVIDEGNIEGVFPSDLDVGVYNVCVENIDGSDDCLLNGLEVVESDGCAGCSTSRSPVGATVAGLAFLIVLALRRRRA